MTTDCFGFFGGTKNTHCAQCVAQRRCKAVLITDGFDIMSSVINHLDQELPDTLYQDSDRVPELVAQLRAPPGVGRDPQLQAAMEAAKARWGRTAESSAGPDDDIDI